MYTWSRKSHFTLKLRTPELEHFTGLTILFETEDRHASAKAREAIDHVASLFLSSREDNS